MPTVASMCASPVALLVACAELLENFKTFAALRPRARLWHELLTQLAGKTLAKGGCLELATVPADGPPVGYLTTLHVGDMDDASLAWAKAATAELLQDGKEWALRESGPATQSAPRCRFHRTARQSAFAWSTPRPQH